MTYKQTIEYLFSAAPAFSKVGAGAYKEGLDNTLALDTHFGQPHRRFLTIHVGGTNGKGSVSHSLAAILQAAGYRVGLYTSPHLVDFRERIRVGGQMVPEQYVIDFVEQERGFFEPLSPSFFELTTALAFKYFAEEQVDVAVIEVGLGGRLDCTNIIAPILSVITNISLDHTQFLGNTLGEIAAEKAGIIKPATPCVVGETTSETRTVFMAKGEAVGAPIVFAEDGPAPSAAELNAFQLTGGYQARNLRTILAAVDVLRRLHSENQKAQPLHITPEAVSHGLAQVAEATGLRGRWQKLMEKPLVICDAGHNIGGWQYLGTQIEETFVKMQGAASPCSPTLRIVFGMVDDKDADSVLALLPSHAVCYFCQASTKRAIPSETLKRKAAIRQLHGRAYATVEGAFKAALAEAREEDFIFVGGSCYVLADLFTWLDKGRETVV